MFEIYLPYIIFFGIIGLLVVIDRKSMEFSGPLIVRKTLRGRDLIVNTANRFRRFFTVLGTIAIIVGFIASMFGLIMLTFIFVDSVATLTPVMGTGIVLPAPTTIIAGGFIGVPLWYWLISIIILLVVHEGFHGLIGASQGMKIKSLGWIILAVLPIGAFVEPDEKQVAKKSMAKQLRFFAAGSFANFLVAFLVVLVITPLFVGMTMVPAIGLQVTPQPDMPFANSPELIELTNGYDGSLNTKIYVREINGMAIDDFESAGEVLSRLDFQPGDTVSLSVDVYSGDGMENTRFSITAVSNPDDESEGYIGILYSPDRQLRVVAGPLLPVRGLVIFIAEALFWIFLINFGVGAFNMMPIRPLDGSKMWQLVLCRISEKKGKIILRLLEVFSLFIVLALIIPGIISNFV